MICLIAEQWSPWFGWWMDLLKFALTFGLSALATVLIINRVEERRAKRRSRDDALFQLQMDALREFYRTAITYEVAAGSAYTDLYQWRSKEKTAAMQRYENEDYTQYSAALDRLEYLYDRYLRRDGAALVLIEELRSRHEERHLIYDALVDYQLDSEAGDLDLWSEAEERREEFDYQLNEAKRLRQEIISVVEGKVVGDEAPHSV